LIAASPAVGLGLIVLLVLFGSQPAVLPAVLSAMMAGA
jgi:hypothetical protein